MINQYLSLFVIVVISAYELTNEKCQAKTKNTPPVILSKPPKAIRGTDNKYIEASCCFDGFTNLQWTFRKLHEKDWKSIEAEKNFEDFNRTLSLSRPSKDLDIGYYRCTAEDDYNHNMSYPIFLYFLESNQPITITIVKGNLNPKSVYKIGENVKLDCQAISYIPDKNVSVTWFYGTGNSKYPVEKYKINTTVSNSQIEANPDQVDVYSHLYMDNVQHTDDGNYECFVLQDGSNDSQAFYVSIQNDKVKWKTLISIIAGIVSLVLIVNVAWYHRFNIMVMYKTYFALLSSKYEKEYDVAILYDDSDMATPIIALTILEILEKYKFRCWHFDRDKHYGQETVANISQVITRSQTIIVLLSQLTIVDCSLLKNLSALQPDVTTKRLYIFHPHKKDCLKDLHKTNPCTAKWLKQELKFQSFIHPHGFDWDAEKAFQYKKLLVWIISSLPATAIREARQRIFELKK